MTKEQFIPILEKLYLAYPNYLLTTEQKVFLLDTFKDYDAEIFLQAVELHIKTEKFNPSIASLQNALDKRHEWIPYKGIKKIL